MVYLPVFLQVNLQRKEKVWTECRKVSGVNASCDSTNPPLATPVVLSGAYMFPNGDKYGKTPLPHCNVISRNHSTWSSLLM